MRGRCVCTAFRSSHARLGAANPEKWHRYSVRKGAPTARVPSLGCLAALDRIVKRFSERFSERLSDS